MVLLQLMNVYILENNSLYILYRNFLLVIKLLNFEVYWRDNLKIGYTSLQTLILAFPCYSYRERQYTRVNVQINAPSLGVYNYEKYTINSAWIDIAGDPEARDYTAGVINGHCRKYPLKDFAGSAPLIDPRAISRLSGRRKYPLATLRNWKRRGLSSGGESPCFRRKSIGQAAARKQARSRQVIRLRLTYFPRAAYKRARTLRRYGLLFSLAYLLTRPMQPRWQHHRSAAGGITMTADATECFSITVSARKDLSRSRISGIPRSRNGAFNAFPLLVRRRISQYEVEIWQITVLHFARCWPND